MSQAISRGELSEIGLEIMKDAYDGMKRAEKSGYGSVYDYNRGKLAAVTALLGRFMIPKKDIELLKTKAEELSV